MMQVQNFCSVNGKKTQIKKQKLEKGQTFVDGDGVGISGGDSRR